MIVKILQSTLIIGALMLPVAGFSQSGRLKYADGLYAKKAYYYASEAYEDVIARKTDSAVVATKIADSYDKIGNTKKAADWFRFIHRKGNMTREQHLRLVLLERQLENYQGANQLMASYQQQYGSQNEVVQTILKENSKLEGLQKDNGNFQLKNQHVNTTHSEIGTAFYGADQVLISSSKRREMVVKRIHSWTGNYYYDVFKATVDEDGQIGKMKLLKSQIKSKFNDGTAVYNEKTGYIYFTRNNFIDGKKGTDDQGVMRLKLYKAKLDGKKFKDEQELTINDHLFSNGHPSVNAAGTKLYFSSDRPEGMGGMDLYSVTLGADGQPNAEPVNLGATVNTSQNELFPSFNATENCLFFASEGHFGLGGLDVFIAYLDKSGNARSIENLGAPINSAFDDFSFVNNEPQTNGYFSSNRNGGEGSDDVYAFKQLKPYRNGAVLKGNVKDLLTDSLLTNTTICIVDATGKVVDSIQTNDTGDFELSLRELTDDFKILGKKDGYIKGSKNVDFKPEKSEYSEDLKLMPVLDYYFVGNVVEKVSKSPLENVKISIRDNAKNQSFQQITTLNSGSFQSNTLPYQYEDPINYGFKLEKDGYITKVVTLNEILAQKAAIDVNEFLSIDLTKIEVGKTDLNDVISIEPIYFDLNKFDIRPDAAKELNKIVSIMKDNPGMVIELGSHTDSRGASALNLSLSDKRAKSSANYIVSQGISRDRIIGKGYGKSKLKVSDATIKKASSEEEKEKLHQQNRRTEFIVVKMK